MSYNPAAGWTMPVVIVRCLPPPKTQSVEYGSFYLRAKVIIVRISFRVNVCAEVLPMASIQRRHAPPESVSVPVEVTL